MSQAASCKTKAEVPLPPNEEQSCLCVWTAAAFVDTHPTTRNKAANDAKSPLLSTPDAARQSVATHLASFGQMLTSLGPASYPGKGSMHKQQHESEDEDENNQSLHIQLAHLTLLLGCSVRSHIDLIKIAHLAHQQSLCTELLLHTPKIEFEAPSSQHSTWTACAPFCT